MVSNSWGEAYNFCIPLGTYTITENVPEGWNATSPNPQTLVVATEDLVEAKFGNKQVPVTSSTCPTTIPSTSTTSSTTTTTSSTTTTVPTCDQICKRDYGSYGLCRASCLISMGEECIGAVGGCPEQCCCYVGTETTTTTTTGVTSTTVCGLSLKIVKYNDYDGDGVMDAGEPRMAAFSFNVTGPANFELVTNSNGQAYEYCIPAGTYVITENSVNGWVATSANPQTVVIGSMALTTVKFGNMQITGTTTTSTTLAGACALVGDDAPCNVITLDEVIGLITKWVKDEADIKDVLALILAYKASA